MSNQYKYTTDKKMLLIMHKFYLSSVSDNIQQKIDPQNMKIKCNSIPINTSTYSEDAMYLMK